MKASSAIVTSGASPTGAAAKKVIRPAPVSAPVPVRSEPMSRKRNGCADAGASYYAALPDGSVSFPRAKDLIGKTPLLDLTALANPKDPRTRVLGKAEFTNPGFSHKDRIIRNIITKAEKNGLLIAGQSTVVCASSGNTGASCAMVCAMNGYKCIVITSPKCSKEKMDSIRAYGATLLVSGPGQDYMQMETDMCAENPAWFSVNQYNNLDNPEAHLHSTGPEIFEQTCGQVSHFVMAGSTGGTISGVGRYLKNKNDGVQIVLADPVGSVFTNYFRTGELGEGKSFLVEGVGKANIPGAMNFDIIDDVIPVNDTDAFTMCKSLARTEGIFVGGSAGLNVHAAVELANRVEGPATIVTLLCDIGIKYLSKVYNDAWLEENGVAEACPEAKRVKTH